MDNPGYVIECDRKFGTAEKCEPVPREYSFEEAVTLTSVGWFHFKLLLVCGLCFMAVMVEIMGISLIMPLVKCDLQASLAQQGFLASAGFLGVVLSSHAMGFLADTWGRVVSLRYAMVLAAISSIVSAFSVNVWMLIICRCLTGFFISGGQACVFSLCGEFHGNRSRVRHVTLLAGFMCVAMMFAPAVATGILPLKIDAVLYGRVLSPWRLFLIANVSITVLALLGLCLLPETPKYQLVQGHHVEALQTLRMMYVQNTGRPVCDYPVERLAAQTGGASLSSVHGIWDAVRLVWQQTVPLFQRSRLLQTLNICCIQFLIYCMAQGIFMWFPTVLNELTRSKENGSLLCPVLQGLTTPQNVTEDSSCTTVPDFNTYQVLITIGASFTMIYLIFAFTIDLLGKRNLLIGWMLITMICLVLLHWLEQFALVTIALTLVMAIGNCGGLVNAIAIDFYPTQINAMAMCFISMVGRFGAALGSNMLGNLLFNACNTTLWSLLGLVLLLSIMAYFLPDHSRAKAKLRASTGCEN